MVYLVLVEIALVEMILVELSCYLQPSVYCYHLLSYTEVVPLAASPYVEGQIFVSSWVSLVATVVALPLDRVETREGWHHSLRGLEAHQLLPHDDVPMYLVEDVGTFIT